MAERPNINETRIWSRRFILLMTAAMFYYVNIMMVPPLIPELAGMLGGSDTVMGIAGGLNYFTALVVYPFIGPLVDYNDKYRLAVVGSTALTLATLGYLSAGSVAVLLCFRVIHGVAFALLSAVFAACVANFMPRDKVSQGLSIYALMHGVAMALAPSLGVMLYQTCGLRVGLWTACFCAAACSLIIIVIKDMNAGALRPATPFVFNAKNIISPQAAPFALVLLCTTLAFSNVNSFLLTYSNAVGPLEGLELYFTIYAIVLIVIRISVVKLLDRLSFGSILLVNCPALAAALVLLQLSASRWTLWLSAALLALGHGIMQTVAQVFCVKSVPPQKRGVAISTYYMAVNAGFAFGPLLAGMLASAGQLPSLYYVSSGYAFIPLLCIPVFRHQFFSKRPQG